MRLTLSHGCNRPPSGSPAVEGLTSQSEGDLPRCHLSHIQRRVCLSCEHRGHWAQSLTEIKNSRDFYLPWIFNSPESSPSAYHNASMHVCDFLCCLSKENRPFCSSCDALKVAWMCIDPFDLMSVCILKQSQHGCSNLLEVWGEGGSCRTMGGNRVGFHCFPGGLYHYSPTLWMLFNFCWCLFILSVMWILKAFHWYTTYCVLQYPTRPVALEKPTAAESLIMHACMQSPDVRPRVPQLASVLTCFRVRCDWADLDFLTHFAAWPYTSLPQFPPPFHSASSRRRPLPIWKALETWEGSHLALTHLFT